MSAGAQQTKERPNFKQIVDLFSSMRDMEQKANPPTKGGKSAAARTLRQAPLASNAAPGLLTIIESSAMVGQWLRSLRMGPLPEMEAYNPLVTPRGMALTLASRARGSLLDAANNPFGAAQGASFEYPANNPFGAAKGAPFSEDAANNTFGSCARGFV
eukprot:gene25956-11639_t